MSKLHVRARCTSCSRVFSLEVEVYHFVYVGDFLTGIECQIEHKVVPFEVLDVPRREPLPTGAVR